MINFSRSGKFRFALVGAGMIGTHHAKVISELADQIDLVAVVNRTLEKAERITAQRGGKAFTSLTAALVATDIDVVVVCTPPGGRAEVAIDALEAGKHVIIEKPAEVTLAKIDDIIAAQEKAGTLVTVISQHRFDPASTRSPNTHYPKKPRPLPAATQPNSPTPTATSIRTSWQRCGEPKRSEWAWPRIVRPSASSLVSTNPRVPAIPSVSSNRRRKRDR
jgi:hypothetical protein